MKRTLNCILILVFTFCASFVYAQNKVVVIPLNSSSSVYVTGTEISSLPYTITASGAYFITKDLTAPFYGITIDSDNVTLDLMGFSLIGAGGSAVGHWGISILNAKSNIEIKNGTIRNFRGEGIQIAYQASSKSYGVRVINIRSKDNAGSGINLDYSYGSNVEGCTVIGSGDNGIVITGGGRVTNSTTVDNGNYGIFGRDSYIADNSSSYNTLTNINCSNCILGTNYSP